MTKKKSNVALSKQVTIQARRRLFFLRPICLLLLSFLVITIMSNFINLYKLNIEKNNKEKEYIELQDESEYLKTEVDKMNNPEYLAKYARENYSYSKAGELIIKFDDSKKEEEIEIETDIPDEESHMKLYIIIGVLIMVFYILLTVIRKMSSKKELE